MFVAIMQPTFLPWLGFFNLIRLADVFIFLDDVQLSPKSFQVRNRIPKGPNSFEWLSIRTKKDVDFSLRMLDTTYLIDGQTDLSTIYNRLISRYTGSEKTLSQVLDKLTPIELDLSISELNIKIIENICHLIGVKATFCRSSQLKVAGKGSEKILGLLNAVNWTQYLVSPGSVKYMSEDSIWSRHISRCFVQTYNPITYSQRRVSGFVSHMSSIDAILELGPEKSRDVITAGSSEKYSLQVFLK